MHIFRIFSSEVWIYLYHLYSLVISDWLLSFVGITHTTMITSKYVDRTSQYMRSPLWKKIQPSGYRYVSWFLLPECSSFWNTINQICSVSIIWFNLYHTSSRFWGKYAGIWSWLLMILCNLASLTQPLRIRTCPKFLTSGYLFLPRVVFSFQFYTSHSYHINLCIPLGCCWNNWLRWRLFNGQLCGAHSKMSSRMKRICLVVL